MTAALCIFLLQRSTLSKITSIHDHKKKSWSCLMAKPGVEGDRPVRCSRSGDDPGDYPGGDFAGL
jgi:hypothetical protein